MEGLILPVQTNLVLPSIKILLSINSCEALAQSLCNGENFS